MVIRTLGLVLLLSLVHHLQAQGPIDGYLKAKGEADFAFGFSANGASNFLDGQGEAQDIPFRGQLISAFGIYGLTDRINLVASVPFVVTANDAGLQDGNLFVKGLIHRFSLNENQSQTLDLVGAVGISAPLSNYEIVAAGAIGQRAQFVQPRMLAQYNRPGFFASAMVGYNYRFDELDQDELQRIQRMRPAYFPNQPEDNINTLIRIGIPTSRFYADAWVEFQNTLGGTDFTPEVEELPQPYEVDYTQIGGTVYYSEGPKWGFAGSAAGVVDGINTSQFWRVSGTVIYKLR